MTTIVRRAYCNIGREAAELDDSPYAHLANWRRVSLKAYAKRYSAQTSRGQLRSLQLKKILTGYRVAVFWRQRKCRQHDNSRGLAKSA